MSELASLERTSKIKVFRGALYFRLHIFLEIPKKMKWIKNLSLESLFRAQRLSAKPYKCLMFEASLNSLEKTCAFILHVETHIYQHNDVEKHRNRTELSRHLTAT